eukprot:Gb_15849 [translate_table: standard]
MWALEQAITQTVDVCMDAIACPLENLTRTRRNKGINSKDQTTSSFELTEVYVWKVKQARTGCYGSQHPFFVAPYNTFYSQLEMDLAQVGVDPTINKWDQPLALGMVDPHDSLSHPAGISDGRSESATVLHPDRFMTFVIPRWFESESQQVTTDNPFILPKAFSAALQRKNMSLEDMRQALRNIQLEEGKKRELANAINAHFKEWLYGSFYDMVQSPGDGSSFSHFQGPCTLAYSLPSPQCHGLLSTVFFE